MPPSALPRRRVLVVDDEPGIRDFLDDLLSDEGYEVVTTAHGAAALAVLDGGWQPHVILLDINMGVMDGYAFAQAYHQRRDHTAPIVVITAGERASDAASRIGAAGHIAKPFDLDRVLDDVASHLSAA